MQEAEPVLEPELLICDPHHHLWDHPTSRYMIEELNADAGSGHRIESTVFVECNSFYRADGPRALAPVGETEMVNGVAAMSASGRYGEMRACAGIVGFADLSLGSAVDPVLEAHIRAGGDRFRGVRHAGAWDASDAVRNAHTNPPKGLYGSATFREGYARLAEHGLSFEAWQFHPQLPEVTDLARAFPETVLVLDHVGGPLGIGPYEGRRAEVFGGWRADLAELAKSPNVVVKLGGLGMAICGFGFHKRETPASSQELAQAWRPYIETCIELFGAERCMFESNFPVDQVSCDYRTLWNALKRVVAGASADEKALLFRDVARRTYRLM
ncbi:MAG: amidohydrolase family protein [Phenylobacterium sp.]|uniref:amidohydrolase family protein n=1 Tax=Phenylobacterium sp. TaxID=1871053 RepID=UPI0027216206|nr:amidohydrolase family protein [Phenylobacterium sp.]MDO9432755.1 amidohydrolase family protein [Phenylobacterium sp.]